MAKLLNLFACPRGRMVRQSLSGLLALLAFVLLQFGATQVAHAQQVGADFDHASTGYVLNAQHQNVRCETCHLKGVFKGTPKDCVSCHGWNNPRAKFSVMPVNHIPTGNVTCESCHQANMAQFMDATRMFNHAAVRSLTCVNCHSSNNPHPNVRTNPMDATHQAVMAKGQACDKCHTTIVFSGPKIPLNHIPTAAVSCTTCHTNTDYSVMPTITAIHANAPSTSNNCQQCHSTANAAAYAMPTMVPPLVGPPSDLVHSGSASCEACHVGAGSSIASTPVADGAKFTGSMFGHSGITSGCAKCHGASANASDFGGVLPKTISSLNPVHVPTTLACEACHANSVPSMLIPLSGASGGMTTFAGGKFSHSDISSGCATCHGPTVNGSTFYGISQIVVMPPSGSPGANSHLPTSTTCESCHAGSKPSGLIAGVATQMPPGSGFLNPAPTAAMIHAGVTGSCSSCHDTGMVWMGMSKYPITKSAPFIGFQTRPQATEGTFNVADATHPGGECSNCHTSFANFNGVSIPAIHIPYAAGAQCSACHGDFSQLPSVTSIHANAPSTSANCAQCHSAANAANYNQNIIAKIVAPPGNHIGMGALGCENCHVGSNSSLTLPVISGDGFSNSAFSHSGISNGCASCHGAAIGVGTFAGVLPKTMVSLNPVHVPTTLACETCHTNNVPPTLIPLAGASGSMMTFAGARFTHSGITTGCVTCHGPAITGSTFYGISQIVVMPPSGPPGANSHLPTSTTCESCHAGSTPSGLIAAVATTVPPGSGFLNPPPTAAMIHAGVTGNCSSCHDTGMEWMSMSKYPITKAAPYTGFQTRPQVAEGTFNVADPYHPGGECSNCHSSFVNFNGPSAPTIHIPYAVSAQCSACHGDFSQLPSVTNIHANAPSTSTNCAQCHSTANAANYNKNSTVKIVAPTATHIPMGALGCESCHVGAGSSMASTPVQDGAKFSGSLFSHTGISSGCASCHGASITPSTFDGVYPKTISSLSPVHVPTTAACETCHVNSVPSMLVPAAGMTTFAGGQFSHTGITTGCETCHGPSITNSSFYGVTSIVVMPPTSPYGAGSHLPTSTQCESCHLGSTPSALVPGVATRTAPGSGFLTPPPTAAMIHAGVTGSCSSCHDTGMVWMSMGQYPITTAAPFKGFQTRPQGSAGTFHVADTNHPATGDCSSCHVGFTAFGAPSLPSNHIPTTAACSACHKVASYTVMPSVADIHANIASTSTNCAQCHSDANAANYNTMASMVPKIVSPPGDHIDMGAAGCESCHVGTGSSIAATPVPNGAKFSGSLFNHAGTSTDCSSCHGMLVGAGTFLGVTPKSMGSLTPIHIPVPNSTPCDTCHINSVPTGLVPATGMKTFAGAQFSHTGFTTGCDTCHGPTITGSSFYGISKIVVMPGSATPGATSHLPTSTTCESCHAGSIPAGLVPGVATKTAPGTAFKLPAPTAAMIHAGVTGNCSSCHETNFVWMGVDQYPITTAAPYKGFQTRPQVTAGTYFVKDAVHPATGDCSSCHGGFVSFGAPSLPANHIPYAAAASCASCHGDFSALPTISKIHANAPSTSVNCAQCHSATNAATYSQNAKRAVVTIPAKHIDMAALGCESCHVGSNSSLTLPVQDAAKFSNSAYSHVGVTTGCATCHGASVTTGTFFGITPKTIASLTPAHIPVSGSMGCEACHTASVPSTLIPLAGASGSMTTFGGAKFSHSGITTGCATCHGQNITNSTFYGVTKIVVMPPSSTPGVGSHLPTTSTCENCHLGSTPSVLVPGVATKTAPGSGFLAPTPTATMIHAGTTGNCLTCHETNMVWMSMGQYPITTTAPFKGFQTRPQNTAGTFFVKDTVHPAAGNCASCHASMNDFTATALPSNHIPVKSGSVCTNCHTNADFSVMPTIANIHLYAPSSTTNCAQCHSETNAANYNTMASMNPKIVTLPAKHVDTAALGCESCHITTGGVTSSMTLPVSNTAKFSNSAYSHTGVSSGCASCHGSNVTVGTFAGVNPKTMVGLSPVHVPSSQTCETCHTSVPTALIPLSGGTGVNTFAGGKFSHTGISTGCDACHGAGITNSSFYGVTKIVVLPPTTPAGINTHIPSPVNAQCEVCHLGSTPAALVPAVAPSTVLGTTLFKTPIPTGAMVHTSITGSCNSCHERDMSWLGVNLYPRTSVFTSGGTYVGFQARPFAGGTAYSINDGAHPTGTADCSTCHGSTVNFRVDAKPSNHIPVQAVACTLCHTATNPLDFSVSPTLANTHAYAATGSTCATCHSVTNAAKYAIPARNFTIKAPDVKHIPFGTTACETCHVGTGSSMPTTTVANGAKFSGSLYSHSGVTTGCVTCHGPNVTGTTFTGVPSIVVAPRTTPQGLTSHIPYTAACEVCHAATTPSGLVTVTGNKPVPGSGFRLPAPSGVMIHANSTGFSCMSCHEANYRWMGVDLYPISPTTIVTGANYKGFQTRPIAAATTYSVADAAHAVGGLATGDCSQCHSGTTAFTAAGLPAGHMPTTAAGATCSICHSGTAGDYSVAGLIKTGIHTGITGGLMTYTAATIGTKSCVNCHTVGTGGTSGTAPFAGCATQAACTSPPPLNAYQPMTTAGVPSKTHVPIGTTDCNGCHADFLSFGNFSMKPGSQVPHKNVALGGVLKCLNCHENGMANTWYTTTALKTRIPNKHTTANRMAPNDCNNSGCHSLGGFRAMLQPIMRDALVSPSMSRIKPTTQTGKPTRGSLGNSFDHKGVAAGKCKDCHDGKSASGMPARHLMVATSCDTCHRPTTWLPAQFNHNGITPNTCLACHNGMGASNKPSGHFMTSRSCDSCHKNMTWTPVNYQHLSPLYQASPDKLTCVSCHDTNGEIIRRQARALTRTKPIPVGH